MNAPPSTEHKIEFPTGETWRDNPRLTSGKSVAAMLTKAGFVVPQVTTK